MFTPKDAEPDPERVKKLAIIELRRNKVLPALQWAAANATSFYDLQPEVTRLAKAKRINEESPREGISFSTSNHRYTLVYFDERYSFLSHEHYIQADYSLLVDDEVVVTGTYKEERELNRRSILEEFFDKILLEVTLLRQSMVTKTKLLRVISN